MRWEAIGGVGGGWIWLRGGGGWDLSLGLGLGVCVRGVVVGGGGGDRMVERRIDEDRVERGRTRLRG